MGSVSIFLNSEFFVASHLLLPDICCCLLFYDPWLSTTAQCPFKKGMGTGATFHPALHGWPSENLPWSRPHFQRMMDPKSAIPPLPPQSELHYVLSLFPEMASPSALPATESLVFFDYNAFDAPRVRTARPSGSDGNVGRVASVSGSESTFAALRTEVVGSNIPEAEEVFVDRDTHMFRLVVLPNSTALGVAASHQSGKPDVRKQALGAAGASSLRQEVHASGLWNQETALGRTRAADKSLHPRRPLHPF